MFTPNYCNLPIISQFLSDFDLPLRANDSQSIRRRKQINAFNGRRETRKTSISKAALSIICTKKLVIYRRIPPIGKYRGVCAFHPPFIEIGLSLWGKKKKEKKIHTVLSKNLIINSIRNNIQYLFSLFLLRYTSL